MLKKHFKKFFIGFIVIFAVVLTGCSRITQANQNVITLAHTPWDTEIASTYTLAHVLEDLGYRVNTTSLDVALMYSAVANGDADATVSAWLPFSQIGYMPRFYDDMVDLGANTEGAVNGVVVPAYMEDTNSIEDLDEQANQEIINIEPGSGMSSLVEDTMEAYPNLADWEHVTSSTGGMLIELENAIRDQEDIVVGLWTPHWAFLEHDLKFLEDPRGTMGGGENIVTFARKGLAEEDPIANSVIDNFSWSIEDLTLVMNDLNQGLTAEEAAAKYVENNPDKVAEWTEEARAMIEEQESESESE